MSAFKALLAYLLFATSGLLARPLRVATLSTVLTEIAREVGGTEATITGLVRPGVDPHSFEPAPSDLRALTDADVILASGLGLENYLDRLAANAETRGKIVTAASDLGGELLTIEVRGRREADPHWWNSLAAAEQVTRRTASEFATLRPAQAEGFARRADAYARRLEELDRWTRMEVASIPPSRRRLVTTHDAFGWFARDYGFTVNFISGMSPDAEPSARDFAQLIDLIRRDRIPAVFLESSANPRLVATLCRESGAKLGGSLYADGLSADGDGVTYLGMYRHNVATIVAALK